MAEKLEREFLEFLLSTEGETREEVQEYLKIAGINIEREKNRITEYLEKKRAEIKKAQGREFKEKVTKGFQAAADMIGGETGRAGEAGAYAFKNFTKATDKNQDILDRSNKKLDIIKKASDDIGTGTKS